MAIAALILGISALVFCWVPVLGILLGIAGIILGALGMKDVNKKGMATAGLVMAIIATVLGLILNISCLICGGCDACDACDACDIIEDVYDYDDYTFDEDYYYYY